MHQAARVAPKGARTDVPGTKAGINLPFYSSSSIPARETGQDGLQEGLSALTKFLGLFSRVN